MTIINKFNKKFESLHVNPIEDNPLDKLKVEESPLDVFKLNITDKDRSKFLGITPVMEGEDPTNAIVSSHADYARVYYKNSSTGSEKLLGEVKFDEPIKHKLSLKQLKSIKFNNGASDDESDESEFTALELIKEYHRINKES